MTVPIELIGLTKAYGRRRGIVDVGVEVREGEVFGFLGPNGAGKTTTIRCLTGVVRPTSGRALVFGLDAWRDAVAVHRRMASVGSDPGYLGELNAADLLDHLGRLRGLARGCWRTVAERLELDPSVQLKKLSRGNRQKVAVVDVFMGDEALLVMDEPSSGLDPLMQREFLGLVAEARSLGRTVFLSSHNLVEVERACDRVGIVRDGRLREVVSVATLLESHARSVNLVLEAPAPAGTFDLPNVRVLAATDREVHLEVRGDVNPLVGRIAGLRLVDVAITTPDIEDVFLSHYDDRDAGADG
ncbi:MAG: ABC transporter ATP-binding protein [Chloroflexi bacterium]|nr:ABC transporter ATP-binding protein [Chloroflexota bacterium]